MDLNGIVTNFGAILEGGYAVVVLNSDGTIASKTLYADLAHTETIYTKTYAWSAGVLVSWTLTMTTTGEVFTGVAADTEAVDLDALRSLVLRGTTATQTALSVGTNTFDSFLVDDFGGGVYDVFLSKPSTGARYKSTVTVLHDGTTVADASNVNFIEEPVLQSGVVDVVITASLNGAGGSQVVRLQATPSTSGWVVSHFRRLGGL